MIPEARHLTHEELQAFAPPDDPRKGMKDSRTALNLIPLASLTRSLRPQPNRRLLPPVFRLGYAVTMEWARDYARKYGLLRPAVHLRDDDRSLEYEDDDDDDPEPDTSTQAEESALPESEAVDSGNKTGTDEDDLIFTIEELINHINDNSGTKSLIVTEESLCPLPCYRGTVVRRYWLIGLTSNYELGPKPTPEDIFRLHHYLGFKTLPAWFLDLTECGWTSRSTVEGTRLEYLCSLNP